MEEIYRLGKHEFATREEWEAAQRDLETIRGIVDHLDIEDPVVAEDIYQLVREGLITFESKLGTVFFCDISDRVAQNFKEELEDSREEWERERKEQQDLFRLREEEEGERQKLKETQQSMMFKILGIACAALAVICVIFYGHSVYRERRAVRKLEEVQQKKSMSQAVDWYSDVSRQGGAQAQVEAQEIKPEQKAEPATQLDVLPEYSTLHAQYPDLAGWLRIDGTQIDLPVMQAADNDYYLHSNIDGAEDINGTLFLDYRADAVKPSTNLIIYGHNMRSGAMFGGLKQYLDEAYVAEHEMIQFDTIYEKQTYQVIAVCLSEVGYQDEGQYKYYNFIEAESNEDFNAFLGTIRKCAVYDKTQDVTESDSLLTLSTCNSYVEDGRLFVVAKKIQ
ncbi:MAG: class B sortase [Eubacterium sp.]|nr:class B sortase [Eubacterium sp.]